MKKNSQYIGVDDKYIPKDEKYVDDSVLGSKEESRKTIIKGVKIFGIGYMIVIGIILAIVIAAFVFSFRIFGKTFNQVQDTMNQVNQDNMSDTMRDEFFNQYNTTLMEMENFNQ